MNIELLKKYCNNACTKEELEQVLEWVERSARTPESKELFSKLWDILPIDEDDQKINFDVILDKIHHKINLSQSEKLLENADENIIRYTRRRNFISILTRVAAILLIPVLTASMILLLKYQSISHNQTFSNQVYNEIFSSVDAITKITLPDGSNVWLNHSSSLKYPPFFQGKTRTVELIGEGYFEVAHNPKIPFIVKAGDIQILARGTTFNILAYTGENRIETSLINGNVELLRLNEDRDIVPIAKMKPSELVIYSKSDKRIITRSIKDERYYSWKDGKLIFKKEPMGEVVKKLNRWFNVDILISDPKLLELTYTATFVNETLPQVMDLLTQVTPIDYSISGRKEINDGIYTKRKIVLSYRKK